jgi:hypothetical protein
LLLILVLGIVIAFILMKYAGTSDKNKLILYLREAKWFENHWLAGLALFLINFFLFSLTVAIIYTLMYFLIPFLHIVIMLLAVIFSILLWKNFSIAWRGKKSSRLIMSLFGSSFYLILSTIFIYMLITLKPSFEGDDTLMASVGLFMAITVCSVAFILCFYICYFKGRNKQTLLQ